MNVQRVSKLERQITQLPTAEQLWLIEGLIHGLREDAAANIASEEQLRAMAADPEIQAELRAIESEFQPTETDGLNFV